jgi:hypothetical protein
MGTSSLASIGRLLKANSLGDMAAVEGLPRPVSARQVMARASFSFLPGWELVTDLGIAKNEQNAVWHAGHVTDVLPLDAKRLLLASASGGVWLVSPDESVGTTALSKTWPEVDIRCLGRGNRGSKHFFAAGDAAALFETGTLSLRSVSRLLNSSSARDMAAKLEGFAEIQPHRCAYSRLQGRSGARCPDRAPESARGQHLRD